MKIVVAADSFKGSLSSVQIIEVSSRAIKKHYPDAQVVGVPIADGGEGTLEALLELTCGQKIRARVHDPIGREIYAYCGHAEGCFFVEMAQASGITLLSEKERDPLIASSLGTGEMIRLGLELGFRNFIVGIGGSATNDGGTGLLHALGVRFIDGSGNEIKPCGGNLLNIESIDITGLDKRLLDSTITVMCDVDNPFTGASGATYVYAPQKGAGEYELELLERGMVKYKEKVIQELGIDMDAIVGAGAAGGVGGALCAFCKAKLRSGIVTLLEVADFESILKGCSFVISGEGRIDSQSARGKAISGIAKVCAAKGVPLYAVCGGIRGDVGWLYESGVKSIMPITRSPMSVEYAMQHAEYLLEDALDRMIRFINQTY